MNRHKAFTLIELMVVILIVAILAAVVAPMLSGRINEAKWTEGKAGAGTIATAIRAYIAENGAAPTDLAAANVLAEDLNGKYFTLACYDFVAAVTQDADTGELTITYTITVDASAGKDGAPSGIKRLVNDGATIQWFDGAAEG